MKNLKTLILTLIIMTSGIMMASCDSVDVDAENSPRLTDIVVNSYSENSEASQYVTVDMIFDRDVAIMDNRCESLRITIADMRVQEDEYKLERGDEANIARFTISVNAITKGVLKISKEKEDSVISEIRSEDEHYAAEDFEIEAIIPSGVTLSTNEQTAGRVVKSVDSYWNIRSIAWVGLVENGELVPVSETRQLEMLDGYAAVHGHEFLMEDEDDIAERITEVLRNNYGDEYRFLCEGNLVTAEKKNSAAELDIEIYTYKKINGKEI